MRRVYWIRMSLSWMTSSRSTKSAAHMSRSLPKFQFLTPRYGVGIRPTHSMASLTMGLVTFQPRWRVSSYISSLLHISLGQTHCAWVVYRLSPAVHWVASSKRRVWKNFEMPHSQYFYWKRKFFTGALTHGSLWRFFTAYDGVTQRLKHAFMISYYQILYPISPMITTDLAQVPRLRKNVRIWINCSEQNL